MPIVRCSICNSFVSKTGICKRCSKETKIEQAPVTVFDKERDKESDNWSIDNQTLLNAKLLEEIGQLRGRIETLEQDYERVVQFDKKLQTNSIIKHECINKRKFEKVATAIDSICSDFDKIEESSSTCNVSIGWYRFVNTDSYKWLQKLIKEIKE